ncbi:MAG: serine/threonine-protein kinase [Kofleriaceae bacterium]
MQDDTEVATVDGKPTAGPADSAETKATRDSMTKVQAERYKVLSRLGKGGMGEVMAVRDDVVGREVALKRIRRTDPSDRLIARFLREATVQGRLEHPSIVPLYDLGRDASGLPFFTMKKLAGTTLAKVFAGDRRDFSLQRLLRAFIDVCLAIEFAHVRGVIHRDLKPDNIVLGEYGEVSVLDWGVAKVIGEPDGEFADVHSGSHDGDSNTPSLATMPGTVVGTPGYMSPEQVRGDADIDGRADVYALGCLLFEILAGSMLHPTGKAGMASATAGIDARPSARAPERSIPPELDELCVQATAVDPAARIQSARELGDRVQRYLDGDRDVAARQKLAAEHLARANAAFAAGDDHRSVAMREAASALALDPKLAPAAELLGRLMLEPPRTTPPEVEKEILEADIVTMRENARAGIRYYVMFLAFMPFLWFIAPQGSPWVAALSAMTTINVLISWWGANTHPLGKEWVIAISNTITLAVVAKMYTPFLIAPGLAAMSLMAIVFTPTRSMLTTAAAMCIMSVIAVLGPWTLELTGTLPSTMTVRKDGILLSAVALSGEYPMASLAAGALFVVALLLAAVGISSNMRERERAAKRALHLQAWQLRQLVPR